MIRLNRVELIMVCWEVESWCFGADLMDFELF